MNVSVSTIFGTHLSSRGRATQLRSRIVEAGERITLDFLGVVSLSDSFADELFGVLALEHDLEWIRDNVGVTNASPEVLKALLRAIDNRLGQAA